MHGHASSSLTPRKPINAPAPTPAPAAAVSLSPTKIHSPTAPLSMARPRRTKIQYLEDKNERAVTRCKRRDGLSKKTKEFHILTRDPVALVTIDPRGKCHCVCEPSIPVLETYLRLERNVMWKEDWGKWLDWAKKVRNSCKTKEDCDSWIRKCLAFLRCLHEKSKDLENNPAVNTGAGDDSRALGADEEGIFTGLGAITILPDVD